MFFWHFGLNLKYCGLTVNTLELDNMCVETGVSEWLKLNVIIILYPHWTT